jgi:hypothetical protein
VRLPSGSTLRRTGLHRSVRSVCVRCASVREEQAHCVGDLRSTRPTQAKREQYQCVPMHGPLPELY